MATIVITGSSSGIGRALALAYAEEKHTLLLVGRDILRLTEVKKICETKGSQVEIATANVTDAKAIEKLITDWDKKYKIDIAIANAGISGGTSLHKINHKDQFEDVITTNVQGTFNTLNPLIPIMMERKSGHLVIISSMAGFRGMSTAPGYSISKVTVKAYGDAIRPLLKKQGVAVSTVFPGFIKTPLTEVNKFKMPFLMSPEKAAKIIKAGIKKKKTYIAFPLPMYLISKGVSMLPHPIYDFILSLFPGK